MEVVEGLGNLFFTRENLVGSLTSFGTKIAAGSRCVTFASWSNHDE